MTDTITRPAPAAEAATITAFFDQGRKLFAKQRTIVRDLESEQALFRVQIADEYKRRMADLVAEEDDRMRGIVARQKEELDQAKELLAILGRLRGE